MAQQGGPGRAALDRLLAKASTDSAFRTQLLQDPPAALAAAGLKTPPGVALKVIEDSPTLVHLVLPPRSGSLSERDLGTVVGGTGSWDVTPVTPTVATVAKPGG